MAFGKKAAKQREKDTTEKEAPNPEVDVEEEEDDEVVATEATPIQGVHSEKNRKPLLDEVTMVTTDKGKNSGGTKRWTCKHCKKTFSSSYTRIHQHFFGTPVGKKNRDYAMQGDAFKQRSTSKN